MKKKLATSLVASEYAVDAAGRIDLSSPRFMGAVAEAVGSQKSATKDCHSPKEHHWKVGECKEFEVYQQGADYHGY